MNADPHYTLYHPRWYRRHVSVWWWLQNRSYTAFVLREITSVFVAFFALVYLWQIRAVAQGPEAYAQFLARLGTPLFLVLNAVTFCFVLFHGIAVAATRGHVATRVPHRSHSIGRTADRAISGRRSCRFALL